MVESLKGYKKKMALIRCYETWCDGHLISVQKCVLLNVLNKHVFWKRSLRLKIVQNLISGVGVILFLL